MRSAKRFPALILILAMIFSILSLFAAAGETAAAEIAAPVVTESVAVEDVAVISDTPAEAPATVVIETVAAETVSASLESADGASFNNGAPGSLAEAFLAWRAAGCKGRIKLLSDVSAEEARELFSAQTDALVLLADEADGGFLTLNLNGHTVASDLALFASTAALDDFELTIHDGTLTHGLALAGNGVGLTMDNVTISGSGCSIKDDRGNGSYTILRGCSFTSDDSGVICVVTDDTNKDDRSLVYYVKDCSFTTDGTGVRVFETARASASVGDRYFNCILDGENTCVCSFAADGVPRFKGVDDEYENNCFMEIGGAMLMDSAEAPYTFTTDASASLVTEEDEPAATVEFNDVTLGFKTLADAVKCSVFIGASSKITPGLTLNAPVGESVGFGAENRSSEFTLDLNGQELPTAGLLIPGGEAGTKITVRMASEGTEKLFAEIPALTFAADDTFVFAKGTFFTDYSLNLGIRVSINLYTVGDPDAVYYQYHGAEYTISSQDGAGAWIVDAVVAKQMGEPLDAYAFKKTGSTTTVDFTKGVSVRGYVEQNPAGKYDPKTQGTLIETLNATLQTMLVYGRYAEKYAAEDYELISDEELAALGLAKIPDTDTSNLVHTDRVIQGMDNHLEDVEVTSGYWGTSAVLEDEITLRFYFYGGEFENTTATVNGEPAEIEPNGSFRYVAASVCAREVDRVLRTEIAGVGSVTDSVEGYASRIDPDENHYILTQAVCAYGAEAKRYYEAKQG